MALPMAMASTAMVSVDDEMAVDSGAGVTFAACTSLLNM
jgi:hypothetical protein